MRKGSAPLPLALAFTAAYLVVAGAAGVLALDARSPARPVAAPVTTPLPPVTTTTVPPPSSSASSSAPPSPSTTAPPAGFQAIEAPGGLKTVLPEGWRTAPGTVATTLVATDPADPRREIRLGGAAVTDPSRSLLDRITEAAVEREREPGHARLALSGTRARGFPAVRWEFEQDVNGAPTRVAVDYWEAAGTEYVIYAAGPAGEWPKTRSLLTTMTDLARP